MSTHATSPDRLKAIIEVSYSSAKTRKFRRAFTLGWQAACGNELRDNCPYLDHRISDNKITFSRAFMRQWLKGYDMFRAGEKG